MSPLNTLGKGAGGQSVEVRGQGSTSDTTGDTHPSRHFWNLLTIK